MLYRPVQPDPILLGPPVMWMKRPNMIRDQPQDRTNPWQSQGRELDAPDDELTRYSQGTSYPKGDFMKKPKKGLECPKCGSQKIFPEAGFITGYKYHCKDCDYMGPFVIEKDMED